MVTETLAHQSDPAGTADPCNGDAVMRALGILALAQEHGRPAEVLERLTGDVYEVIDSGTIRV